MMKMHILENWSHATTEKRWLSNKENFDKSGYNDRNTNLKCHENDLTK